MSRQTNENHPSGCTFRHNTVEVWDRGEKVEPWQIVRSAALRLDHRAYRQQAYSWDGEYWLIMNLHYHATQLRRGYGKVN